MGGGYRIFQNEKNLGYVKNFEKAIGACSGEYIFLSDQDDVWMSNKIEKVMQVFKAHPDVGLVFHDARIVDADLNYNGHNFRNGIDLTDVNKIKKYLIDNRSNVVQGASAAIKQAVFRMAYPFPKESFHDYWLAITALLTSDIIAMDEVLLLYRQHQNNALGAHFDIAKEEKNRENIWQHQKRLALDNMKTIEDKITFYRKLIDGFSTKQKSKIYCELVDELTLLQDRRKCIAERKIGKFIELLLDNKRIVKYNSNEFRHDLRSMIFA